MALQTNVVESVQFSWFQNFAYRYMARLLKRGTFPLQSLCTYRTISQTYIHIPSGIRTYNPILKWQKTLNILDRAATVIGTCKLYIETYKAMMTTIGDTKTKNRILMSKPLGKRPLERPRRICDDYISTDLKKVN